MLLLPEHVAQLLSSPRCILPPPSSFSLLLLHTHAHNSLASIPVVNTKTFVLFSSLRPMLSGIAWLFLNQAQGQGPLRRILQPPLHSRQLYLHSEHSGHCDGHCNRLIFDRHCDCRRDRHCIRLCNGHGDCIRHGHGNGLCNGVCIGLRD